MKYVYAICAFLFAANTQAAEPMLRAGAFVPLALDARGHYRSEAFPGLWLDPAALLRGDLRTVLALVQQGLASPEHAEFAARLGQGRADPAR